MTIDIDDIEARITEAEAQSPAGFELLGIYLETEEARVLCAEVRELRAACKRLAQDRYNEVRLALEDVKLAQVVAVGFPHEPWCQAFEEKEDLPCNCQRKKLLDVLKSARTNLEPLTLRPAPEKAK